MVEYLVLTFNLAADSAFRDQTCKRAENLASALLLGAWNNLTRGGVMIVRKHHKHVEVVARCGLAENPIVAAYVEADVRLNLWPGLSDVEGPTRLARTVA